MGNMSQDKVIIRPMTRSDIHAVLALDRKFVGTRGLLSYKDMATIDPGGPLDVSFVAEIEGNLVGHLIARLEYVMIPFIEICLVQGVLVDPDYQHRSIGSRLFRELLDYCQTEGINTIRTLVEDYNDDLQRFVARLGFHRSTIVNYDKTFET
jgi:ribosomal protein S18 acetylase RimI-like enzyme